MDCMADVASIVVVPRGEQEDGELVVAGCFEGEAPDVEGAGEAVREAARRLGRRAGWQGRDDQVAQGEIGHDQGTLAVYGLGERRDLTFPRLRRWFARAAEAAAGAGRVTFVLPRHAETAGEAAERILRGLALSSYRYDRYLTESVTESVTESAGEKAGSAAFAVAPHGRRRGGLRARSRQRAAQ
jgi:leucyl aminopeptidase